MKFEIIVDERGLDRIRDGLISSIRNVIAYEDDIGTCGRLACDDLKHMLDILKFPHLSKQYNLCVEEVNPICKKQ